MNQLVPIFEIHGASAPFETAGLADGLQLLTPIGHAVEILGLTPRALRHYEDKGLIWANRNASNSRCYDARSLRRLQMIRDYRKCGLSLADIRGILEGEDDGASTLALEQARNKLAGRLVQIAAERALVANGLERIEHALARGQAGRQDD